MDTVIQPAPSNQAEVVSSRKSRRRRSKQIQFELLNALFSAQRAAPAGQPAAQPRAEEVETTVAYALRNMRR